MPEVIFTPLQPEDVHAIEVQPSQRVMLGIEGAPGDAQVALMCGGIVAWAAWQAGRLVACFGISELVAGLHGCAWALLAEGIGAAHLPVTRFARAAAAACPLARIELLARAPDMEALLVAHPGLDTGQIVALAVAAATPEIRWAMALGFRPAHVLRCYGPAAESLMLCERIRPDVARSTLREAA